jgi:hypothetical protein
MTITLLIVSLLVLISPFVLYITFRLMSKAVLASWKEVFNPKTKTGEK